MVTYRERGGRHNETGALGETVARKWLNDKGFSIVADNYRQKTGEIDVIAKQSTVIHFVEVKTVSYDSKLALNRAVSAHDWRPEEQVHEQKIHKISRTIEIWLLDNKWEGEWQIDIAAVRLVPSEKYARINWLWNVIA